MTAEDPHLTTPERELSMLPGVQPVGAARYAVSRSARQPPSTSSTPATSARSPCSSSRSAGRTVDPVRT